MAEQLVSVITPVHSPALHYVEEAFESVASQELPLGWSWEWLVQDDGDCSREAIARRLPHDQRISIDSGRRGGASRARNLALSRAQGALVKVLDVDDKLTPGALARDISVLSAHRSIGWTTSGVLDLLPDGSTTGFDHDPVAGAIDQGAVLDHWLRHNYRAQVHPATLCIRRELLLMLGGWMALPGSGDTGLLLAANAVSAGYFIEETGLLYRKWPGQVTADPAHADPHEREVRMSLIEQRARALAHAGWSWEQGTPLPLTANHRRTA